MSKLTASKWIDILGLITTIIGVVATFIDQVSNKKEKKGEDDEVQETQV